MGVFASWPQVNAIAQGMGTKSITCDPMLDYWLRMISGAFTLVGLWYLALAALAVEICRRYPVAWCADVDGRHHPVDTWRAARFAPSPSTAMSPLVSSAAQGFYSSPEQRGYSFG